MKVFIFSTHIYLSFHKETELELIQNHLDQGDEVYRFYCDGFLPVCDVNPHHSLEICLKCRDARIQGNKLLKGNITELPLITNNDQLAKIKASHAFNFSSLEQLQQISIQNFDLGYAASSSLISTLRDPNPDVEANREIIEDYLYSSLSIYFSTIQQIQEIKPDLIYLFNGRLAHVKPVMRASELCNVNYFIHERGYDANHYELYNNAMPHDASYFLKKMNELWDKADPLIRIKKGEEFYQERFKGVDQAWLSFTKHQKQGLLPADWNTEKRNVVIFNSSEDEFAALGPEWANSLYETQAVGIKRLVEDCLVYPDIHFYLRIHPNLIDVRTKDVTDIENLKYPNLTIILAGDKASSYDLLFNCEKVITFGSTVGIEAVYWGKPSVELGKSFYYNTNAAYTPLSHEETVEMIVAKLEPKGKLPALKFGFYYKSYGIPFKRYHSETLFRGSYLGVFLSDRLLYSTRVFLKLDQFKVFQPLMRFLKEDFKLKKRSIYWALRLFKF